LQRRAVNRPASHDQSPWRSQQRPLLEQAAFSTSFFNISVVNVRQRHIFMEDNTTDGNIPQPVTSGTPRLWLRREIKSRQGFDCSMSALPLAV
jgi:hypothetical protein